MVRSSVRSISYASGGISLTVLVLQGCLRRTQICTTTRKEVGHLQMATQELNRELLQASEAQLVLLEEEHHIPEDLKVDVHQVLLLVACQEAPQSEFQEDLLLDHLVDHLLDHRELPQDIQLVQPVDTLVLAQQGDSSQEAKFHRMCQPDIQLREPQRALLSLVDQVSKDTQHQASQMVSFLHPHSSRHESIFLQDKGEIAQYVD